MMFQKGRQRGRRRLRHARAPSARCGTRSGWGGETQALIYNPKTKKVIGINALGVAPTGATPEFFKAKGMRYPPEYGPLAAVTPGTPGGLMVMLAEFGTTEPEGRARAGHPDGRRLPDRAAGGRRDRAPEGRDQEVAVLARPSS